MRKDLPIRDALLLTWYFMFNVPVDDHEVHAAQVASARLREEGFRLLTDDPDRALFPK